MRNDKIIILLNTVLFVGRNWRDNAVERQIIISAHRHGKWAYTLLKLKEAWINGEATMMVGANWEYLPDEVEKMRLKIIQDSHKFFGLKY
jgi:hypothetical protein